MLLYCLFEFENGGYTLSTFAFINDNLAHSSMHLIKHMLQPKVYFSKFIKCSVSLANLDRCYKIQRQRKN